MKTRGTSVTFYTRPDGALTGYRAEGHSGYAPSGTDIVCAGVSALTQSTLNGLANVAQVPMTSRVDDRSALLEAIISPDAPETKLEQAQLLLRTLLEGLQAIERSYPRNVRIFFEERR